MTAGVIPSPLGLLHRSHHAGSLAATDAVVLSFGQDLAFFERAVLGVLSQTKARITLVADAQMVEHDPYSVRRAGTAYLPGLAVHHGAFHPKMMLLVSDESATVCIGSGNLTLSGWQGNDEIWSIHTFDADDRGALASQTAAWLRELSAEPGALRLSVGVADRLTQAASKLKEFGTEEQAGDARLISSLARPIIDQLPKGPVDELVLYAPYHDKGGRAVEALVDRFQPRLVRLAFQARHTSLDGERTASILGERGIPVAIDDRPFRHGKLIEWSDSQGRRTTLTGSPNLSDVALLRSAVGGGNVELAVLSPVEHTLLPEPTQGNPPLLSEIAFTQRDGGAREEQRVVALLLDATKRGPAIQIRLIRDLPDGAYLEHSALGASPDEWRRSTIVDHQQRSLTIAADLAGGSRIRVRLADGTWSQMISVVDFESLHRSARSAGATTNRAPDVVNAFGDDTALMASILDTLAGMNSARSGRPSTAAAGGAGRSGSTDYQAWDDYLENCHERIGDINLSFALGLPMESSSPSSGPAPFVDWDDDLIADELGALEGDEPGDEDEHGEPELSDEWYKFKLEAEARRRYRRQIEKFTDELLAADDPDPIAHLMAIRLVLLFAVGGIWGKGEEWRDRLLRLVAALDRTAPNSEWETSAGSLAALALSIVDFSLRSSRRQSLIRSARDRTVDAVGYLTLAADDERIGRYAQGLSSRYRYAVDPKVVLELAERVNLDDPLERSAAGLVEAGVAAEVVGRVLVLGGRAGSSKLSALRALPDLEEASPIGIYSGGSDKWALVLWAAPDLFVVQPGTGERTAMFHHYRYDRGSPATDIRASEAPSDRRFVETTAATYPPPARAIEIAAEVGIPDILSPEF